MQLGHLIAQLRDKHKISQKQLAEELCISHGLVGLWETNKRTPSLEYFVSLIDYFSISADALLKNDRKLKPEQYQYTSTSTQKIMNTFCLLNEDNQDILIGEAKKLLKSQHNEENESEYKKRISNSARNTDSTVLNITKDMAKTVNK